MAYYSSSKGIYYIICRLQWCNRSLAENDFCCLSGSKWCPEACFGISIFVCIFSHRRSFKPRKKNRRRRFLSCLARDSRKSFLLLLLVVVVLISPLDGGLWLLTRQLRAAQKLALFVNWSSSSMSSPKKSGKTSKENVFHVWNAGVPWDLLS